jgi:hypothetical protein
VKIGYQAILAGARRLVRLSNVDQRHLRAVYGHMKKGDMKKAWQKQIPTGARLPASIETAARRGTFKEGPNARFDAGYSARPCASSPPPKEKLQKTLGASAPETPSGTLRGARITPAPRSFFP